MRWMVALVLTTLSVTALAQGVRRKPAPVDAAIQRGLTFVAKDAMAWKSKHNCVSCHHAALAIWSLREARQRGHSINEPVLAELTKWTTETMGDGKTGLARPAGIPKALNAKAVWFAMALGTDPQPDAATQAGLKRLWETVKSDQTETGAWAAWPETRPPFFGNSDESMTTLATLSLLPATKGGDEEAQAALDRGVQWLTETKSEEDPQSVAMRLVLWKQLKRPEKEWRPLVRSIKQRQNADGGWSQTQAMESDAWATGEALYALASAGMRSDAPAIQRARTFLIRTQRDDGSWPMMSRPTKPGEGLTQGQVAITGAASAWAVLGLVRSR